MDKTYKNIEPKNLKIEQDILELKNIILWIYGSLSKQIKKLEESLIPQPKQDLSHVPPHERFLIEHLSKIK
jgi:hypothetical protein